MRRRRPILGLVAVPLLVLLAALLLIAGCASSEPSKAEGSGSGDGEASEEWEKMMKEFGEVLLSALRDHLALMSSFTDRWESDRAALEEDAEEVQTAFDAGLAIVRSAPANSETERRANEALGRGLVLLVSAYDDYLAGIASGEIDRLDAGDRAFSEGQSAINEARDVAAPLMGTPSTSGAAALRSVSTRMASFKHELDRALALERRFFRQWEDDAVSVETARTTAVKVRQAFAGVAGQFEDIPAPFDQRVARFVKETQEGYNLIAAAFGDYVRAIDAGKESLLERGDTKRDRAYRLIQEAADDLTAYAEELGGL